MDDWERIELAHSMALQASIQHTSQKNKKINVRKVRSGEVYENDFTQIRRKRDGLIAINDTQLVESRARMQALQVRLPQRGSCIFIYFHLHCPLLRI